MSDATTATEYSYLSSKRSATLLAKVDFPEEGMPQRITRKGLGTYNDLHNLISQVQLYFLISSTEGTVHEEVQESSISSYDRNSPARVKM